MLINHPGSWQQFQFRSDNKGLSVMEMKSKYLHEQYLFENELFNLQQQHQNWLNGSSGGTTSTSTPTYSTALQLTFNDTLANMSTNYGFDVTSATAWNNTGKFTYNGSNSNFGTVEIVNSTTINLKGNEEGIAIETDTFSGDTYLIVIEDLNTNCITEVKNDAFSGSTALERTILNYVTIIGFEAFNGCQSLQTISFNALETIPNASVDTIEKGVFNGCSLSNLDFEEYFTSLTTVGSYAFYNTNFRSVRSSIITTIGKRAFASSAVDTISFTNIVNFGDRAFASSQLNNIELTQNCTFFDGSVFSGVPAGGTAYVTLSDASEQAIVNLANDGWTINP